MPKVYKAKAPGSCMLLGEYAVLKDYPAIVLAIDSYITVTLTPRNDDNIHIKSALGEALAPLDHIPSHTSFRFIKGCIESFSRYSSGFNLEIESDFSHTMGLGSSAAVTVATLACLHRFKREVFTPQELLIKARTIIRNIQGNASGADVAASVYGGLICYSQEEASIERFYLEGVDFHLIYCGYKTPTAEVIKIVENNFDDDPEELSRLLKAIGSCVNMAKQALKCGLTDKLGLAMRFNHLSMLGLGVCDKRLSFISNALSKLPDILGAKISGSGLGDCIIALGDLPKDTFPQDEKQALLGIQQIDIELSKHGLEIQD